MSGSRAQRGEPSGARTWAAILVTLCAALVLLAVFGGPKDVRLTDEGGIFSIASCGPSEPRTFPSGVLTNTDARPAHVVAVTPDATSSNVEVRDFAVIDAGPVAKHLDPETAMSVGSPTLPVVAHPHEIQPGHQAIIEVRLISRGRPSHLSGYDITVADGPDTHVVHDAADVTFTGSCNAS